MLWNKVWIPFAICIIVLIAAVILLKQYKCDNNFIDFSKEKEQIEKYDSTSVSLSESAATKVSVADSLYYATIVDSIISVEFSNSKDPRIDRARIDSSIQRLISDIRARKNKE